MKEISVELQNKIDTIKNKYAALGILVSIVFDQRHFGISLTKVQGNIKKFVVPDFIEIIGEECFKGNSYIEEIIIKSLDTDLVLEGAFMGCINLKKLDMSKSGITFIKDNACTGCTNLTDIKFSRCLEYLGVQALANCIKLKELHLPSGVTYTKNGLCSGCVQLSHVEHNLKVIGEESFYDTNISDFDFKNIKKIDHAAFVSCRLKKIVLNNIEIGISAFKEQKDKIELISINDGVTPFIHERTKIDIFSIFSNNTIEKIEFNGAEKIPESAFSECVINSIEGMENIDGISTDAFKNSTIYSGLNFDKVEYIGIGAFMEAKCNWNNPLELGKNTRINISDNAFERITNTSEEVNDVAIIIYNALSIGKLAFVECEGVKLIQINNVETAYNFIMYNMDDDDNELMKINLNKKPLRFRYNKVDVEIRRATTLSIILLHRFR